MVSVVGLAVEKNLSYWHYRIRLKPNPDDSNDQPNGGDGVIFVKNTFEINSVKGMVGVDCRRRTATDRDEVARTLDGRFS